MNIKWVFFKVLSVKNYVLYFFTVKIPKKMQQNQDFAFGLLRVIKCYYTDLVR